MNAKIDLIRALSSHLEPYITLERVHPTATYDYKARDMFRMPVIETTTHQPKVSDGSWLYVAVRAGAKLDALDPRDKLYVGSQTVDRMFRGDGMKGRNFHHAQMRAGNGADTLCAYLRAGGRVTIHRISQDKLAQAVQAPALQRLGALLSMHDKHLGYWFEQYVLAAEGDQWRWNTAGADAAAHRLLATL